ncbi:MAG TPA: hypothetical protein VLQ45_03105 [Thermoanaerobaculia bacterium]|nr:hypothetical protein [Thermoanaerobaculia bacterium]
MFPNKVPRLVRLAVVVALLFAAPQAQAVLQPSSDVLLPYFELDLAGFDRTTLFAICNDSDNPVDVLISVHTNWGISVLSVNLRLEADQVRTVNLRDWLILGNLPDRKLGEEEIDHLQAALSGVASPKDKLYYSTEVMPGRAVGYIEFRVQGSQRPDVLWGDYFIVDPKTSDRFAQGETLVDIDRGSECRPDCDRHGVRFLQGGGFDAGTELMIWTNRKGRPSPTPEFPDESRVTAEVNVYDEPGHMIDRRGLKLLPVQMVEVGKLEISQPFGWFDLVTEGSSFVTAHFSSNDQYSVALHSYCLPEEDQGKGPGIRVDKLVNGIEADVPTGPKVPVGNSVRWEYIVTNTGDVPLVDITVVDDPAIEISCPQDTLEPGESMSCTASETSAACQRRNLVTAAGWTAEGVKVDDDDVSYYYGEEKGFLDVEAYVGTDDADLPPGPSEPLGSNVPLRYVVTNTGDVTLSNIVVTESAGMAVACPKTTLAPDESMTCNATANNVTPGQHSGMATAVGTPECGKAAEDTDPCFFFVPIEPAIGIKKYTNDQDADLPPGPVIKVGDPVQWKYVVSNIGNVLLTNVFVTDDRGVAVTCPKTVLDPAESMTCTASGTAVAGQYANTGTATGTPVSGPNVTASDPSHYFGHWPMIHLEKLINGIDADAPPCPNVLVGSDVLWSYVVVNTGDVPLSAITVTDDRGLTVTCPKTALQPGESMTCTATGKAVTGQYTNIGTATGQPEHGPAVTSTDPSCYFGWWPMIHIEKLTNNEDADVPPGPTLLVGGTVQWKYVVTNAGDVRLTNVAVTDNRGVAVSCPKTALDPGESMTCTGSGTAAAGQYSNLGTATGSPESGPAVSDTDPSHYFGAQADITLEKLTNGEDADTPPGPSILVGDPVLWTYVVTNTGTIRLTSVSVTDSRGVTVTCPKTALEPGESMTCTGTGTATAGQYANVGTATGRPAGGSPVTASDPSHYKGRAAGNQGCTPGYWKNHTDSWPPTGYSTSQKVKTVFANVSTFYPTLGNATLLQALAFSGGSGGEGAAEILLRAAVAALLNASHPDVAYPRTAASVIADVNNALLQNRDAMLTLAAALDADNNRGCPLN